MGDGWEHVRARGISFWLKRHPARMIGFLVAISSAAWLTAGCTVPGRAPHLVCETCRIVCGECEEPDRFVRLQGPPSHHPRDRYPHFSHPARLRPEDWVTILRSIHVQKQGQMFLEPISKLKRPRSSGSRLGKLRALRAVFPGKQQFVDDSGLSWNSQPRSATDFEIGSRQAS